MHLISMISVGILAPMWLPEQLNQPKKEDVDPLEGLVEKTVLDPGAPFTPEVLERLVAFKKADRPAFEMLRSKLKKAGCRVTALDNAIYEERRSPKNTSKYFNRVGQRTPIYFTRRMEPPEF
jgi:hypothetical protein